MQRQDIKKAGLRITVPRIKILEVLERKDGKHVSAEAIYRTLLEEGEEASLATVYRVLTQFELAGIVTRHHFGSDTAVFEIDNGNHDHIICGKCGKITEFTDNVITDRMQKVAKNHKAHLTDYKLTLYVDCCSKQE